MAGKTFDVHHHFHPASVPAINIQIGRFGYDDQFRNQLFLFDEVLPAEPVAVLFHDCACEVNTEFIIETQFFDNPAGCDHRSHAAFLVHAASADDHAVADFCFERICLPK